METRETTPEIVLCTGCGVSLPREEATYGTHADTYSGTVWHCPECVAHPDCAAGATR